MSRSLSTSAVPSNSLIPEKIRPAGGGCVAWPAGASRPTKAVSRVLVGFDGSPAAVAALERAVDTADPRGAFIELIGFVPKRTTLYGLAVAAGAAASPDQLQAAATDELELTVRTVVAGLSPRISVRRRIVVGGWRLTVREALRAEPYDLVVMPSSGLGRAKPFSPRVELPDQTVVVAYGKQMNLFSRSRRAQRVS